MGCRTFAAPAFVIGAGLTLAGCVAAQAPAPTTEISPAVAVAPPGPNWQWSDAGPAVFVSATEITPAGSPAASLSLICDNQRPSLVVTWDAAVASAGQSDLTYRFDGQPPRDVSASAAGPKIQIVSDPLVVSRFIDEAAYGRQLVVRAAAAQATFSVADDAGNLKRFRTVCPDGTN